MRRLSQTPVSAARRKAASISRRIKPLKGLIKAQYRRKRDRVSGSAHILSYVLEGALEHKDSSAPALELEGDLSAEILLFDLG